MPVKKRETVRRVAELAREAAQPRLEEMARKGVLDLASLPRDVRWLAVGGYVMVGALLAAVLTCELAGRHLPGVTFTDPGGTWRVPALALGLASVGCAAGWAYLLTGAGYCRPLVMLPVAALGIFELMGFLGAAPSSATWLLAPWALVLAVGAHLVTRSRPEWREQAMPRFLPWLTLGGVVVGLLWRTGGGGQKVAEHLDPALIPLFMLAWPFCLLLGVEVVDGAIELAGSAVGRLRRRMPEWALRRFAIPFSLLCWLTLFGLMEDWHPGVIETGLALASLVVMAVLAGALVLWLARHWSARAAAVTLGLQIAALPLGLGLALAIGGQNLAQYVLSKTGLFPPTFLFDAFVVFDALNFGPRFANRDSRLLPRSGRVLLYFGLVILVLTYALLRLSARSTSTGQPDDQVQSIFDAFVVMGLLGIGTPYLGWALWKHPERLTGESKPDHE